MKRLVFILLIFCTFQTFGQLNLDSLKSLASNTQGVEKVEHLSTLAKEFFNSNLDSAKVYSKKAEEIAQKTNDDKAISRAYHTLGQLYYIEGNLETSLDYHLKALELRKKLKDANLLSESYNSSGAVYTEMSNYENATKFLFEAIKIQEELNDQLQLAEIYNNVAILYYHQEQWEEAISYMRKCVGIDSIRGNLEGMGYSYSNMGAFYYMDDRNEEAIEYHEKALEIRKKLGNQLQIARSYNNIANVYSELKEFDKAFGLYEKSIDLKMEVGSYYDAAITMTNVASTFNKVGKFINAKILFERSEGILDSLGSEKNRVELYKGMSQTYEGLRDYRKALHYRIRYDKLKDSILNETKNAQIQDFMAKYDAGQKELRITKLEQDKVIQEAETKRQTLQRNWLLVLAVLCVIIILLTVKFLRDKQKVNRELHHQRDEIAEKNSEIIDSISYAKRIQKAILPRSNHIHESFEDSFILYQPKDIVAGDFYFFQKFENEVIIAVADCTGHGVPGAMVSVVCHFGLSRAIKEYGLREPSKILDQTRAIVVEEFQKSDAEVRDGMDISMMKIEFDTNGNPVKASFAGANNPLYLINPDRKDWPGFFKEFADSDDGREIKGDKQPIGKYRESKPFQSYSFDLEKGDQFYLFSDGYCDQFGGDKPGGKKFKSSNFKKLLVQIQKNDMKDQKHRLTEVNEKWRGEIEQIDDICIIGFKI